ncbi:6-phosphogluconolactonase [Amycolatopsis aidingensis]|uniref:6-phosphogluconolactonase n=1 Tax=Amycolatopsis aidingensis TaxID=2842453 RepID=UPI001C0E2FBA|nr:6-phosphogluconolactonase [Amycolatopsis aidingensis]
MSTKAGTSVTVVSEPTRAALGRRAGTHAGQVLRAALRDGGRARVMLAAAPSQSATLATLARAEGIDWTRVELFHMDEYVGLPPGAPQGFATWLAANFVRHTPGAAFHRIDPGGDPQAEAERYEALLGTEPFDLVLLGLGVNGHLAFNDPPADLDDPLAVRVVALDAASRRQQVEEGHFATLDDVPTTAVTVTIPRLLNAGAVIASVPGRAKRTAVAQTLGEPIGPMHPGTALRTHPGVTLYVDAEADPR